ncbi:MAG: hypothetical protein EHM71_18455, partial [Zetaproteobacteria bacterium]
MWLGRAEIRNLRVDPGPGEGAEPIVQLGRGELRVGISSLWRRQVILSTVLLQDLVLRIVESGQGGSAPPLDIPDTLELGPVTVGIGTVRIERGRVLYRDQAQRLDVVAQDLDAALRPVRRGIDVSLRLATLSVQTPGLRETFAGVEGSGWVHQDLLSIRALAGRWETRPLRVDGEIRHPFATLDLALRVRGEVDLAQVSRRIEPPWPLAGIATVTGDIRGPLDAPRVSGQVSVPRLSAGPVQAQDVAVRGQWSPADLDLRVQTKLDLALLAGALKTPWPLAGLATAEAEVRGAPDAPKISGRTAVPYLKAGPVQAQDVSIRAQWSDGVLDLPDISGKIFDGAVHGSARIEPDRLQATRAAFVLQRASIALLDALAPTPLGMRGTLDLDAEIEGDPRQPESARGRFRLAARQLGLPGELNRLGVGELTAAGTFRDAAATLTEAAGRWPGLQLGASGVLGAEGPTRLRFTLDADLGTAAPAWDLRGVAGLAVAQGEVNGRWSDLELAAEARAAPITVAGVTLDTLHVPFRLRGTTLAIDSATASLGQSRA